MQFPRNRLGYTFRSRFVSQLGSIRYLTGRSWFAYLHEVGQQAVPTPSRITKSSPRVEIILPATVPTHGVQYATTTQHLALRHRTYGTIQLGLRYSGEVPVINPTNVRPNVYRNLDDIFALVSVSRLDGKPRGEANTRLLTPHRPRYRGLGLSYLPTAYWLRQGH